jgi:hypothetical protein
LQLHRGQNVIGFRSLPPFCLTNDQPSRNLLRDAKAPATRKNRAENVGSFVIP